jgi:hypothetical protein
MATARKRPSRKVRTTARRRTAGPSLATLKRRVAQLLAERTAQRARHGRELAAARRSAERQLASMVREIAELRHHQARTEALTRVVAERDAALAAQAEHIARLEALVGGSTGTA